MNFLAPRIVAMLPSSTLGLVAYYSLLCAECGRRKAERGWTPRTQPELAKRIGRKPRIAKLYERVLRDLGLVEVIHHQASNRRHIRVRELDDVLELAASKKATPALRRWTKEWGNALPHGGATRCPTLGTASSSLGRRTSPKNPLPPTPPAKASVAGRGGEQARRGRRPSPEIVQAVSELAGALQLARRWYPRLCELSGQLESLLGAEDAVDYLGWSRRQLEGVVDPAERGARCMAIIRARVRKLEERGAPRGGRLEAL